MWVWDNNQFTITAFVARLQPKNSTNFLNSKLGASMVEVG